LVFGDMASNLAMAELIFEIAQLIQGALPTALLFGWRSSRGQWSFEGRVCRGVEPDAADVEIFLKPIELEEIGKFERSDIAPSLTDFLLQVSDDSDQVGLSKAGAQELVPKPLPVKTQGEVLAGEAAIALMQLLDLREQG
jgi:hypothetical protein